MGRLIYMLFLPDTQCINMKDNHVLVGHIIVYVWKCLLMCFIGHAVEKQEIVSILEGMKRNVVGPTILRVS